MIPRTLRPSILVPKLLHDKQFRRYWAASTISVLGDGVTSIALPLTAALVLQADSAQMGLLNALAWAPSLLFAWYAGALADRVGRQRAMMITADLGCFALLASIPLCYAWGVLTLWQLYAVVFATGACSVLFNVCDATLFASLVRPAQYVEGQSLLYGSQAVSSLAGPSLGGLLIQALSAPLAVVTDAVTFLLSALLLSRGDSLEPSPDSKSPGGSSRDGIRFIRRSRVIGTALGTAATVNFFNLAFHTLLVLYLTRVLHCGAGRIGILLAAEAVGGVIGAAITTRIERSLGVGRALLIGSVTISAPLMIIPMCTEVNPLAMGAIFMALLASGFGRAVQNVSIGSIFSAVVPHSFRSRVRGSFQTVSFGARLIGALLGGALGTVIGLRPSLLIGAVGGTLVFMWFLPTNHATFRIAAGALSSASE
ncbi:MFS transporter [Streptomyces sp. NPDC057717]|uniref:MFS transporter n=1 Tax=Streptomyces sp. NPDC057717 TaxID=3346224 RepID=UPI00367F09DB